MNTFQNNKSKDKSDNYDAIYVKEVLRSNNLLDDTVDANETLNSNLDSDDSGSDLDDICTSISQKPVNPLYDENASSVRKIALPKANLVEDDRFWRKQVSRSNEMANNIREDQNEIQDQQIVTLASSSSSSPDSFTPFKTIKDRNPDIITMWNVSLVHGNLLIVGRDKDGEKPMARACNRRISSYIFHDSNGIVCSLLGPIVPDKSVPKYIIEKFKMGIPEDWQIVIQYWRHYKSVNCPAKYNWPALPHSSRFDQTTNWYEMPDSDASFIDSGHISITAQNLSRKIAKMQKMLRATILKESLSKNTTLNNSIRNNSLFNRQSSKMVDSVLTRNNTFPHVNQAVSSHSASKVQSVNISSINSNKFEKVSFHKKSLTASSEPEESETDLVTDKKNDNSCSKSDSFYLEPLISENSSAKLSATNQNHKQVNSGSDIFPSRGNKNVAAKKNTSLKFSEISPKTPSVKKVLVLNRTNEIKSDVSEANVTVSSRGRTRVSTLPFWQGSRLVVKNDSTKLISAQKDSSHVLCDSDVFRKPPDVDTLKIRSRKKKSQIEKSQLETNQDKSQLKSSPKQLCIVMDKINVDEYFNHQNVNTVKKQSRKKSCSKPKEGITESILNIEEIIKPCHTETMNKNTENKSLNNSDRSFSEIHDISTGTIVSNTSGSKCGSKKNWVTKFGFECESESVFEKSTEIAVQNEISVSQEFLKSPIKKGNRKKDRNKSQSEKSQSESNQKEITEIPNEFLKPPDIDTNKNKPSIKMTTSNINESISNPFRTNSNVSNVSDNTMSLQSLETSRKARSSRLSDTNSTLISMNSSVSSRGRRRVPTLPFWQGHRMTMHQQEVVIEKSTKLRCTLENYINDDSCPVSTVNHSAQKKKSTVSNTASPVLSYQEVFNETAFKKPGPKSKIENSRINMQLMSTLRDSINDDTINKSNVNNQSTSRCNLPFNNVVNNNTNKTKNIGSKPVSPTKSSNSSPTRNSITSQQSNVSKNTPKQLKHLKKTTEETNDTSITNDNRTKRHRNEELSPVRKNTPKPFRQLSETTENLIRKATPVKNDTSETNKKPTRINLTQEQLIVKRNTPEQFRQLKNTTAETNSTPNRSSLRLRTRSAAKKQNDEIKQLKNHILEDKYNLTPTQSPVRKRTKSTKKSVEEINKQLKNNTAVPLEINIEHKTCMVQDKNKLPGNNRLSKVEITPETITKLSIRKSSTPHNSKSKIKRNHTDCSSNNQNSYVKENLSQIVSEKSKTKTTPKRSERLRLKVNYNKDINHIDNENNLIENKKVQQKNKPTPVTKQLFKSPYKTRTSKVRPKKYRAENNFNFTVENISHIEENIPNRRNIDNNKKGTTRLSPKQTTQFKVPKKTKIKQMIIPTDPNELYLLVNKYKKPRKKALEVREVPEITINSTTNSPPRKRKLFLNKNWMQSIECLEHLAQNNPIDEQKSPKFVLTIDPVANSDEFDVVSDVNAMI